MLFFMANKKTKLPNPLRYVDLFCGIGGFRLAAEQISKKKRIKATCLFSADIDPDAQDVYEANFGERPVGDITIVDERTIPNHDILFGGFPCQAFSIIGDRHGFKDTRGTLFFDIARILNEKKPPALLLENVRQLETHNGGKTLAVIMETLAELGYYADYRVLNALDFGLPHKRERIFIVGFRRQVQFEWPKGTVPMVPLSQILETRVRKVYYASERIRRNRDRSIRGKKLPKGPSIWHENKSGNVSPHPFSCALRAGASYNYLLVNGQRRLTELEMLRLQGFPDTFQLVNGYTAARRQTGNTVAVPVVASILQEILSSWDKVAAPGRVKLTPKMWRKKCRFNH